MSNAHKPLLRAPEEVVTIWPSINAAYHFADCQDAFTNGERDSGSTYFIQPTNTSRITKAVCQFDSTSGWTVIQKRLDGSVDFFRYYDDYVEGFGNMSADYWIGWFVTRPKKQHEF